jgi:hypothetical protein
VAFAKNGSNYAFYINGVQNETGTWQPDALTLTKPGFRFVGGNNNPPYEYFTGVIDEAAVWNKTLTQDEIMQAYNSTSWKKKRARFPYCF